MRPLDPTCSFYLRYQERYQLLVLKPVSILDPVNLLSLYFGYCSLLVQWDCNRYNVTHILKGVPLTRDLDTTPDDPGFMTYETTSIIHASL